MNFKLQIKRITSNQCSVDNIPKWLALGPHPKILIPFSKKLSRKNNFAISF